MFLVTGGAGFIGSHLVSRLIELGEAVRVLDNFATGTSDNLDGVRDRADLIEGDVRDAEAVRRAVSGARRLSPGGDFVGAASLQRSPFRA